MAKKRVRLSSLGQVLAPKGEASPSGRRRTRPKVKVKAPEQSEKKLLLAVPPSLYKARQSISDGSEKNWASATWSKAAYARTATSFESYLSSSRT